MENQDKLSSVKTHSSHHKEDLISKDFESLHLNDDGDNNDDDDHGLKNFTEEENEPVLGCLSDNNPFSTLSTLEEEEKEEEVEEKPSEASERAKQLSKINGRINRMRVDQLKKKLKQQGLDTNGTKIVLQKRLKAYYKRTEVKETVFNYNYYVVIDFEATCDVHPHNIRHEIIEFPAVLVSTKKKKIVGKFHSYVRPVINPKLTTFCTNLTGITQDQVNHAPEFPEVLQKFNDWLKEHKLKTDMKTFAIVTDGPWDMGRFLYHQCKISKVPYPHWAKTWINIKKPFCNYYDTEKTNLNGMLTKLGLNFIGQLHSGLDDAYNIARVALKLSEDGANMRVNEQINFKRPKSIDQRVLTFKTINRSKFISMMKRRSVDPPREGEDDNDESSSEEEEELSQDDFFKDRQMSTEEEKKLQQTKYEENFPSLLAKS